MSSPDVPGRPSHIPPINKTKSQPRGRYSGPQMRPMRHLSSFRGEKAIHALQSDVFLSPALTDVYFKTSGWPCSTRDEQTSSHRQSSLLPSTFCLKSCSSPTPPAPKTRLHPTIRRRSPVRPPTTTYMLCVVYEAPSAAIVSRRPHCASDTRRPHVRRRIKNKLCIDHDCLCVICPHTFTTELAVPG